MSKTNRAEDRASRAAEARAAQQRAERRRTIRMATIVAVGMALVILAGFLLTRALDTSKDVSATPAGTSEHGVTVGDPDAPHSVIVYEDFLCPFCGELEGATRDDFERLAEEGSLLVEYRPFNLLERISDYSPRAVNAFAVVLEESGPEVAKRYHDLLFDNQPSESGPFPDNQDLLDLAVEAGAEEDAVSEGILEVTHRDWVDDATAAAIEAGVQGTPTVILDGEVVQGGPQDILDAVLEATA
ncbi:thioredoxin domain-containing protein [Nocardioides marinus]|uniref:Protein-disulfide isomerase n=1 Tax=Nocardioides marinus TaxID=374514 RepID=A0A7Y9YH55_9ACTN|nr:thioredoxin domain-containing protein [Nocardioides marinus]NYI10954.1 protein-disulfide isomerase [Nocardioides marinus]